jgi:hypothetical protein
MPGSSANRQYVADLDQDPVAKFMAVGIVDRLEEIDIAH